MLGGLRAFPGPRPPTPDPRIWEGTRMNPAPILIRGSAFVFPGLDRCRISLSEIAPCREPMPEGEPCT
jgi:hypothetical protein